MPGQGAAAVVFDDEGHLLLIKENYERRRWTLPGGALEDDEAPQDAVVREVREETGAEVAIDHLVGIYRNDEGFAAYVFRCSIVAGAPDQPPTGEIAAVAWVHPNEIPSPMSNLLRHALPDALAGERGVIRDSLPRVS